MKRKIFSALMFGALITASTTFTSCKDYDDDIKGLQEQIDANASVLKQIQDLIKSGSVITNVVKSDNGVTVTLSNNETFTISNGVQGEKGDPGTTWNIGEDGFWYKDGVKTTYYALGTKGDKGDKGDQGDKGDTGATGPQGPQGDTGATGPQGPQGPAGGNGTAATTRYYVPNPETGCFDIWVDDQKVESTNISFLGSGTITAIMDNENLTLYGVKGSNGPVVISLTGDLRSLVYMSKLYFDGIETYEYKWLQDTVMVKSAKIHGKNRQNKDFAGDVYDYNPNWLENDPVGATPLNTFSYGPAWGIQYHMNPSNANTEYADIAGFNVLEPDVYYYNTRAAASSLGVTSPEKNDAGASLFMNSNGVLTAGLKIAHPELLNNKPTDKEYQKDNTIALQVKSATGDGAEGIITSDYALLLPSRNYLDGLIWNKKPTYKKGTTTNRIGDEKSLNSLCNTQKIHVWDSPQEALADLDGPALELYFDSQTGITLSEYLAIHYVYEDSKTRKSSLHKWTFGQEKEWGLSYEFNLVDYTLDGNNTHDSKYAKWVDQSKGQIRAWNVKYDGTHADGESASSIDREPLVQVLVKNAAGQVVLDGYILLHITTTPPTVEQRPNNTTSYYPEQEATFDLCNGEDVFNVAGLNDYKIYGWSNFNDYVLTQQMENMTKDEFDAQYEPDVKNPNAGNDGHGNTVKTLNIFENAPAKGSLATASDLGEVWYYPNADGTTNHAFYWTMTAEELEYLTHDKTLPVTVTRYIRFKAINDEAKYEFVYIKMTVKLTRKDIDKATFSEKINNYWYALDGKAGKDGIIFDAKEPIDGVVLSQISRSITSTLVGNKVNFINKSTTFLGTNHKYYFAPVKKVVKSEWENKEYKIYAKSNSLSCKYFTTTDKHVFTGTTNAEYTTWLAERLNACAIRYDEGIFTNDQLFVEGYSDPIATLNQTTGNITLINNEACRKVLNAVGYPASALNNESLANTNIDTEMRGLVGIVAENSCGLAESIDEGAFTVSWQRPINFDDIDKDNTVDAKTNATTIYIIDYVKNKLFDWRGKTHGYMWNDHQWFWGYYDVKAITVDMNPANVMTNMHQADENKFVPLKNITTESELTALFNDNGAEDDTTLDLNPDGTPRLFRGAITKKYNFDCTWANSQAQNDALLADMNDNEKKLKYGAIYYSNNGDNVRVFDVKIPISITYSWGTFKTTLQLQINTTQGH